METVVKKNEIQDLSLTKDISVKELVQQFKNAGFQAQNIGEAAEILQQAKQENAHTFLSFTSNMTASGLRGIIIDLVSRKKVNVLITTSGSIDEDIIRAKHPYLKGSFEADDERLGKEGINRMGNVYVPNDRYQYLDELSQKLLKDIYKTHKELTASELLAEIGKRLDNEDSIIAAAAKNAIPIYCPGITDGAFGMQLAFFQQKNPDFKVDVVSDFSKIMDEGMTAKKTLGIVLGGGIAKHHLIISNIFKGLDYAIYINSSSPYHGSLSGATTEEAKSWGKIKSGSRSVTIHGDAAVVFPLLVATVDEFF